MSIFIFADNKGSHYYYFYADIGLRQLLTLIRNGKSFFSVNLLIDQNIILYLLLYEIICLDDENFWECVLVVSLICWRRFHFQ